MGLRMRRVNRQLPDISVAVRHLTGSRSIFQWKIKISEPVYLYAGSLFIIKM